VHQFVNKINIENFFLTLMVRVFTIPNSYINSSDSGVDSASNRNEYQEYFLGVNAAGA
jgi:hypothetical protein